MKKIVIMLLLGAGYTCFAQTNIEMILKSVEENNTTLRTYKKEVEAQTLENKTNVFLANPEMQFNYLWGSPQQAGRRIDFSIRQPFDFPTVYAHQNKLSTIKDAQALLQYEAKRMDILLQTKMLCIDLVYFNAMKKEQLLRLEHAERLAYAYQRKLDGGSGNSIERNKAQMNWVRVKGELSRLEVERKSALRELKRLNGGVDLVFSDTETFTSPLVKDFELWYKQAEQNNPVLQYVKGEIDLKQEQSSVLKAQSLPQFSAGYMSEKTSGQEYQGQQYQGVSIGMSIPLWENKNKVKQSRAAVEVAEAKSLDAKLQFYNRLQTLYERSLGLQATAHEYRTSLKAFNSTELLNKALDAGEISLMDYILEISLYYEAQNKALEAERDFEKAQAELGAVEL